MSYNEHELSRFFYYYSLAICSVLPCIPLLVLGAHIQSLFKAFLINSIYLQTMPGFLVLIMCVYKSFTLLVGPTVTRQVQDPIAVTRLENQLHMNALDNCISNIHPTI